MGWRVWTRTVEPVKWVWRFAIERLWASPTSSPPSSSSREGCLQYCFRSSSVSLYGPMTRSAIEDLLERSSPELGWFADGTEGAVEEVLRLIRLLLQATQDGKGSEKRRGSSRPLPQGAFEGAPLLLGSGLESDGRAIPFLVDVSNVSAWDSVGLAAMLRLLELVQEVRGPGRLVGAPVTFWRLAELYGLLEVLSPLRAEQSLGRGEGHSWLSS